jgi:hypothetical protein
MSSEKEHEQAQVDKFRDLARELECDEDEGAFDERLRRIAGAPRNPKDKPDGEQG